MIHSYSLIFLIILKVRKRIHYFKLGDSIIDYYLWGISPKNGPLSNLALYTESPI